MPAAQPAALKLLKGRAPGKDTAGRPVKLPPKFRKIPPKPPSWLDREAKAEWNRVSPELTRLSLLKEEDRAALAAYCESWSTFVRATRTVHKEGLTIMANQGLLAHPAVAIARNAGRELRTWATHFGLTPSSEQNLATGDADSGDDSPFA